MTKFTHMAANEDEGQSRRRIHLREISGDSDNPLETVGQDLRAARIRRGDDLAAVSRALKIRKDHLDALEGDRLDDLPGKTYAIGFVRSYARYLGLDAAEFAQRFKAEISGRGDDHAMPTGNLEDDRSRLPYGWRILAFVLVLVLLYGVWHIFFASRETAPPVPPPPSLAKIIEPSRTDAPAAVIATPAPEVAKPAAAAAPAPAPPASAPVTIPAVPQAGQALNQPAAGSRIVLRARGATRITIKGSDGRALVNRDLVPGDVYYVPNQAGLVMALSNAGAVEADLDGKSLGRVGADNQVVGRVSLDPQSLVDRFNTH